MSNYTQTTDFSAKDSLPSGNAGKIIKGSDFDTEFAAIETAIATKVEVSVENTWTAQQVPMGGSATATTTADWNCDTTGQVYDLAVGTDNFTLNAPSNVNNRACYILRVTQHGSTPRTITWNAAYKFAGGADPVLTATASAVDIFTFIGATSNTMHCVGQTKAVA
jgi:hypothetical protein